MVEDAMPLVLVQGKPPVDCKDMSKSLEAISKDLATLKRAASDLAALIASIERDIAVLKKC
jgi:hypothetical protein